MRAKGLPWILLRVATTLGTGGKRGDIEVAVFKPRIQALLAAPQLEGEDDDAVVRLQFVQETLTTVFDSRWKPRSTEVDRRDAIASASSNSSTAPSSRVTLNSAATFFGVSPIQRDSSYA